MATLIMTNPATGEVLGKLEEATPMEVEAKMERAKKAFGGWSTIAISERLSFLTRLRQYIVEHGEELAEKISRDTGKVFLEAYMTEIFTVADFIKYYESHAEAILNPKKVPTPLIFWPKKSRIYYKPMGVIAVISPWNYPFQLSLIPVISALISGNTVLLKPSEITPLTGLVIEEVLEAVQFPPGVVQVLHGGREVGQALVNAKPDKIFFTGSVATGKKIMAEAAKHLIPVELELGGKDPMIVFNDANIERAVNGALWGAYTNTGQVCMSVERLYVQQEIYEEFVKRVAEKLRTLRSGEGGEIGCMTSPQQVEIVRDHLEDALKHGGRLVSGGELKEMYITPTILIDVNHDMKVMREETFGPILTIMPFRTEDEAIQLANDSPYGLNASVWTKDKARGERVTMQLQSGNVCINDVLISVANPHLPFGGIKQSGFGRYHGAEGLYTFCHITSVMEDQGKKTREINWYPYTKEQREAIIGLTRLLYGRKRVLNFKFVKTLLNEWRRTK